MIYGNISLKQRARGVCACVCDMSRWMGGYNGFDDIISKIKSLHIDYS